MGKILKTYPILSLCLFIGIVLLPNLSLMEVSIMEARNFITAREMITDGHWFLTTMNGEPRYEKPPLPTWLTALSALVFGVKSVFGMRLPAVLLVMLLCSFVYKLSLKLELSKSHSLRNGFICATSFYVIGIVLEAPWDIFTHGFMMVAIYFLFQIFEKLIIRPIHVLMAGVFIGLSFLSKGPISVYALLLPFLFAYAVSYKYTHFKHKWGSILSLVITAVVIGGSWYVAVRNMDPDTFNAIAKKETGNWGSYNVRPFYYYWSFFTQSGLWTIPAFISLLYPYMKSRVSNMKAYKLSFYWTLFAVILLSVIPEKKSRYLMPVLIPLSINIGFYIEFLIQKFKTIKKGEKIPVFFNFGLIALIGLLFPFLGYFLLKDHLEGYWVYFIIASILLFGNGAILFNWLLKGEIKQVFLFTVLFFGFALLTLIPLKQSLKSDTYKPISNLKEKADAEGLKIYKLDGISPEMIWQFGDNIPDLILDDGVLNLPLENQFGVLFPDQSIWNKYNFIDSYDIKFREVYDLNLVDSESKKHNARLVNYLYIFTKK